MDDIKRFEDKLDKVTDKISSIDVTLVKQSTLLDEHIRRTNILESKLEPVEKHVVMINGVLKFLGALAIFIGLLQGLLKLVGVV